MKITQHYLLMFVYADADGKLFKQFEIVLIIIDIIMLGLVVLCVI